MNSIDITAIPSLLSPLKMILFSMSAMVRMSYFLLKSFFHFRSARRTIDLVCVEIDSIVQGMTPVEDLNEGVANVRAWVQSIGGSISRRYFSGIVISVFYLAILSKILCWRMGNKGEAAARMTTYGLLDKTGEMVLEMHALASYANTALKEVSIKALKELYEHDEDFQRRYDAFIAEYGHRGPGEFDIASITWHEDETLVYGMLTNMGAREQKGTRSAVINRMITTLSPGARYFARLFLPRIKELTPIRETAKHYIFKIMRKVKEQLFVIERVLIQRGFLEIAHDIFFLTLEDLEAIRDGRMSRGESLQIIHERKAEWQRYVDMDVPDIVYGDGRRVFFTTTRQKDLNGTPLSYGRARGCARIIRTFAGAQSLQKGDILVTHHTDPGWTPFFSIVGGVIIEVGGLICHGAMVARELGLPAIVLPGATTAIPDGAEIEMDADSGTVRII
jgi:pyruvate,water dikinase